MSLQAIVAARPGAQLVRRSVNGGKGAAIKTGLRAGRGARLQPCAADGRRRPARYRRHRTFHRAGPAISATHDLRHAGVRRLGAAFRVCTDATRRTSGYGINTLSLDVRDSMCGFRVYPLRETLALMDRHRLPDRMDFDVEVMVRAALGRRAVRAGAHARALSGWRGCRNFRLWEDNARISWMHTRLFGGIAAAPAAAVAQCGPNTGTTSRSTGRTGHRSARAPG